MKFRTMWTHGPEECWFGLHTETFKEAELVLAAFHKFADFLDMHKDNFMIEVLDGIHWEYISPMEYQKYRMNSRNEIYNPSPSSAPSWMF